MGGLRRALRADFLDSRAKHAALPIQRRGVCRPRRFVGAPMAGSSPARVESLRWETLHDVAAMDRCNGGFIETLVHGRGNEAVADNRLQRAMIVGLDEIRR